MKKTGICLMIFLCGLSVFAKNVKVTLVADGKSNSLEFNENCTEITLSSVNGLISEISGLENFPRLEKLVCYNISFARNMHFAQKVSGVKVLVLQFCSFDDLDFLRDLPSLEAVSAPASATKFSPAYEIDFSENQHLAFFFLTHSQRNFKFKRIKALPPSMEVFSTPDALFDMSNLRALRDAGGGKLVFDFYEPIAEKLAGQGLEFATAETYAKYNQKYNLGMK